MKSTKEILRIAQSLGYIVVIRDEKVTIPYVESQADFFIEVHGKTIEINELKASYSKHHRGIIVENI